MKAAASLLIPFLLSAAESPATRARAVLTQGVEQDVDTRMEVAIALSLINSRDPAVSLLSTLVRDKDHTVRETAIVTIGELNDAKLAAIVVPALQDDVPEVVFAAARTLAKLKHAEGKRALMSIIGRETKAESSFFRGKMRDIARRMKTPRSALLFAAQAGAGFIPVPGMGQGFSAMNSMMADAEFSARATALLVLSTERSEEIRSLITESFNDEDWSVRAAAIQAAALRNERAWRPQLEALLPDANKKVRFRAAAVYLRLNQPARAAKPKQPPA